MRSPPLPSSSGTPGWPARPCCGPRTCGRASWAGSTRARRRRAARPARWAMGGGKTGVLQWSKAMAGWACCATDPAHSSGVAFPSPLIIETPAHLGRLHPRAALVVALVLAVEGRPRRARGQSASRCCCCRVLCRRGIGNCSCSCCLLPACGCAATRGCRLAARRRRPACCRRCRLGRGSSCTPSSCSCGCGRCCCRGPGCRRVVLEPPLPVRVVALVRAAAVNGAERDGRECVARPSSSPPPPSSNPHSSFCLSVSVPASRGVSRTTSSPS